MATNENDVLHDFFANGEYRPRSAAETHATSSPSMDISKASNFERMLFDATLRNSDLTAELFANKVKNGGFSASDLGGPEVMERIRGEFGFASGTSTHADRVATIKRVSDEFGVLVDPHTADGVYVAEQFAGEVDTPIVVLETALPVLSLIHI